MEVQFLKVSARSLQAAGGHKFCLKVEKSKASKKTYPRSYGDDVDVPMFSTSRKGFMLRKVLQELNIERLFIYVCHELELVGVYAEGS